MGKKYLLATIGYGGEEIIYGLVSFQKTQGTQPLKDNMITFKFW